jgi:hypothetical protein
MAFAPDSAVWWPLRAGEAALLDLRPNCECCDRDLPPPADARVCTFECTFCPDCAEGRFGGVCPNCGGDFTRRPIRPAHLLERHPPSPARVLKAHPPCAAA